MFLAILFNSYVSVASLCSDEESKLKPGTLIRRKWNSFTSGVGNRLMRIKIFERFFVKSESPSTEEKTKEKKEEKEEGTEKKEEGKEKKEEDPEKQEEDETNPSTSKKRLLAGYHDDTANEELPEIFRREDEHPLSLDEFKVIISDSESNKESTENMARLVDLNRKVQDLDKKFGAMESNLHAVSSKYDQILSSLKEYSPIAQKPLKAQKVSKKLEPKNLKNSFKKSSAPLQTLENSSTVTIKKSAGARKKPVGFFEKMKSIASSVLKTTSEKAKTSPHEMITNSFLGRSETTLDSKLSKVSVRNIPARNAMNLSYQMSDSGETLKALDDVEELLRLKAPENEFAKDYLKFDESCSNLLRRLLISEKPGTKGASSNFDPYLSFLLEPTESRVERDIQERKKIRFGETKSDKFESKGEPVTFSFVNETGRPRVRRNFLNGPTNHEKRPRLKKYSKTTRRPSSKSLNISHSSGRLATKNTSRTGYVSNMRGGSSKKDTFNLENKSNLKRKSIINFLDNKDFEMVTKYLKKNTIKRRKSFHPFFKSTKLKRLSKKQARNGQNIAKNGNASTLRRINSNKKTSNRFVSFGVPSGNTERKRKHVTKKMSRNLPMKVLLEAKNRFSGKSSESGSSGDALIEGYNAKSVNRMPKQNGLVNAESKCERGRLKNENIETSSAGISVAERWDSFVRENAKRNSDLRTKNSKRRIRFADENPGGNSLISIPPTFKVIQRKSIIRKSGTSANQKLVGRSSAGSSDKMDLTKADLSEGTSDEFNRDTRQSSGFVEMLSCTEVPDVLKPELLKSERIGNRLDVGPEVSQNAAMVDPEGGDEAERIAQFIEKFEKKLEFFRNSLETPPSKNS